MIVNDILEIFNKQDYDLSIRYNFFTERKLTYYGSLDNLYFTDDSYFLSILECKVRSFSVDFITKKISIII